MDLTELTALEQAELVRTKQISAEELLDAVLERTERMENKIHGFVTLCREEAREKARRIDKRIAAGEEAGPLAGVPYSAKDVFCTRGIQTTAGSRILRGWKPPYSAAAVERMDAAGAVLFGKTNCDEFAMGGTNETSAYTPLPCNPYDAERTAGGSSGGSAAAAIQMLKDKGCKNIHFMCIIAAPEGVKAMTEAHPDVDLYVGALDEKLNDHCYIVPGLGDAGDRIFGTK